MSEGFYRDYYERLSMLLAIAANIKINDGSLEHIVL
jgi:hypothetical protein